MSKNEMYISVRYFFTVTLKPYMFQKDATEQYDETAPKLVNILEKLRASGLVVAELTKSFNIHYHGYIDIKTRNKYPMKLFVDCCRIYKCLGMVNISQVKDEMLVKAYIKKAMDITCDMINRPSIIFNYKRTDINAFYANSDEGADRTITGGTPQEPQRSSDSVEQCEDSEAQWSPEHESARPPVNHQ